MLSMVDFAGMVIALRDAASKIKETKSWQPTCDHEKNGSQQTFINNFLQPYLRIGTKEASGRSFKRVGGFNRHLTKLRCRKFPIQRHGSNDISLISDSKWDLTVDAEILYINERMRFQQNKTLLNGRCVLQLDTEKVDIDIDWVVFDIFIITIVLNDEDTIYLLVDKSRSLDIRNLSPMKVLDFFSRCSQIISSDEGNKEPRFIIMPTINTAKVVSQRWLTGLEICGKKKTNRVCNVAQRIDLSLSSRQHNLTPSDVLRMDEQLLSNNDFFIIQHPFLMMLTRKGLNAPVLLSYIKVCDWY